jgi:hypothetical protein
LTLRKIALASRWNSRNSEGMKVAPPTLTKAGDPAFFGGVASMFSLLKATRPTDLASEHLIRRASNA